MPHLGPGRRTLPFLFVTLLSLAVAVAQPFDCPKDCTKYGNCNRETGLCDCPYGKTGDSCENDVLPACRLSPDADAHCGHFALRPCQCLQQCRDYLCLNDRSNRFYCHFMSMPGEDRACFHRPKLGDKQSAEIPARDEPDVEYYQGYIEGQQVVINYTEATNVRVEEIHPNKDCPDNCNNHGVCFRWNDNPNMQPVCKCYRGWGGGNCEVEENTCLDTCGGHGKCRDSFCHCEPGYWGLGCGRSEAYPENSGMPHPTDFKIYIYDLPIHVANEVALNAAWGGHDGIYTAYKKFNNRIVNSPVRTQNPWEANMFYIPAFTYHYTSNLGHPESHLNIVIDYVRMNFPFWNKTDGRDHILWTPGDRTSCLTRDEWTRKPMKLTHFGYFDHKENEGEETVIHGVDPIWGCYHPLRDIVMPPYYPEAGKWTTHTFTDQYRPRNRTTLFFFAGGFRPDDKEYSGGTRHAFKEWIEKWNDPDFQIGGGVSDYEGTLRSSKFCLAPYGHGWGIRIVQAMAAGCVPVVIQEHVYQPFEDILPYEEFSIRLNNQDIPRMPDILRLVTDEQYEALSAGVEKYYRAFIWDDEFGGTAFEYSLLAIRRRWMHHKSLYFGRHGADKFL